MTPLELLRAARAKITPPGSWTRYHTARTLPYPNGEAVPVYSSNATCWCAIGALCVVKPDARRELTEQNRVDTVATAAYLEKYIGTYSSIANFNDNSTHDEVLAVYDGAIALAEAEHDAR